MGHDKAVKWSDETLELDQDQMVGWTCETRWLDDDYWVVEAKGPCPACKATIEASTTNREGPFMTLDRKAAPGDKVKVPVDCNCGYSHEQKDEVSCGRHWTITCELEEAPK